MYNPAEVQFQFQSIPLRVIFKPDRNHFWSQSIIIMSSPLEFHSKDILLSCIYIIKLKFCIVCKNVFNSSHNLSLIVIDTP